MNLLKSFSTSPPPKRAAGQHARAHGANSHRTPAPTPELNATQKWWAAFMGDRAFARARAVGKNEAGHTRANAEAGIALSFPEEHRD